VEAAALGPGRCSTTWGERERERESEEGGCGSGSSSAGGARGATAWEASGVIFWLRLEQRNVKEDICRVFIEDERLCGQGEPELDELAREVTS
jgi:hypothetical protein